jgi:hypothetical protein
LQCIRASNTVGFSVVRLRQRAIGDTRAWRNPPLLPLLRRTSLP